MPKIKKEKPLTLTDLANYNQEVLFPYIDERLETKLEEKLEVKFNEKLKDLTKLDDIVGKLDKLLIEKDVSEAQDKRKTKVLEIHNGALKRNKILSPEESLEVDQMGAF